MRVLSLTRVSMVCRRTCTCDGFMKRCSGILTCYSIPSAIITASCKHSCSSSLGLTYVFRVEDQIKCRTSYSKTMTAQYKKLEKGHDLESGQAFLDDSDTDQIFNKVPQAQGIGQARYGQQPDDHLLFAILTAVFCSTVFGIAAIAKSVDVRNKWLVGDVVGATQSSRAAKRFSVCSLVCGVLFFLTSLGLLVAFYTFTMSAMEEIDHLGQPGNMDQLQQLQQLQNQQQTQLR
eukprot:XP_003731287.1 PREDICTED: uncharacterized protein LOC100890541 isoform X1 [Strongylocentrotus purpuratus]